VALSVRQVSQVIAFGQVIGMIASFFGGGLSDRWGHKRVLILGIITSALSGLVFIFQMQWIVVVLWGLSGVGIGFATLSSQGYLTLAASANTLGVFSALYNWGYTVGGAIGNPLAALLLDQGGFNLLGVSLLGLGIITTVLALFLPRLRQAAVTPDPKAKNEGYKTLLRGRIYLLGLLRFLPTCYYGVMVLMPLLIKQQGGSNTAVAAYAAVSAIIASITQLVAGRISDRLGVRVPTTVAFIVILLAILGTIITAPKSVWGLYIFGTLGVSAAWALSTLLPSMVSVAAESEIHGRVFGMLHLLWTFAMMLGTLLGGALLEIDIRLPFVIVGVLNIVALGLTVPFFRSKMGTVRF